MDSYKIVEIKSYIHIYIIFFPWCSNTYWTKASSLSRLQDHTRTHTHTHSIGLLSTSDQPDAQTATLRHTTPIKETSTPSVGRTRRPSMRATADTRQTARPLELIYIYLTAVGFTPGGSSTSHIYTQTIGISILLQNYKSTFNCCVHKKLIILTFTIL
jgi:hypothetical protein